MPNVVINVSAAVIPSTSCTATKYTHCSTCWYWMRTYTKCLIDIQIHCMGRWLSRQNEQWRFYDWVHDKLILNLWSCFDLVLDNAPRHNVQIIPAPSKISTKNYMHDWLSEKNVPYSPTTSKSKLYQIIKIYKLKLKGYKIVTPWRTYIFCPPFAILLSKM
jgi:hypothetical protein